MGEFLMTTINTITSWFNSGVAQGATNMAVHWDSFDGPFDGDYPKYFTFTEDDDIEAEIRRASNGDKLMEVYVLDPARREEQMSERRAFHYELPGKDLS
jgi:hypothetical protein